jgi:cation diffusion facilitator CzcD-associated flavoprotein CzcO
MITVDTLIMGAGMSGLCTAIQLKKAGRHNFLMVEKSQGLGGTWWDNRYPGAHVDVPSPLYAFSFAPHRAWSRRFAAAPEILGYMQTLAQEHGLHEHLRLGLAVQEARFDETSGRWIITLEGGERIEARHFVCSTAPLSVPRWPDIAGLERFAGPKLHTARWDPTAPLQGRRVGVIGTGSTASQLVPKVAAQAAKLHVFQRTPNWVMPRLDRFYGPLDRALAALPGYNRVVRLGWAALSEWLRRGFEDGSFARKRIVSAAQWHLRHQVADPVLRSRLAPPYPFGCKRVIFSSDYFPALAQNNVELVTEGICEITSGGIVTQDGREHALDVLVCATGFDVQHSMSVPVLGRGGQPLQTLWADGAMAHLGTTVAGFPNLFLMLGPNTATGHTSTLLFIETQVAFVLRAMRELEQRRQRWLDVKPQVMARFNDEVAARLEHAVWSHCRSWYRADNGRNVAIWPGYTLEYRRRMAAQTFADFEFG